MVRCLIAILALGSSFMPALAVDRVTVTHSDSALPMRFEWHTEEPADQGGRTCRSRRLQPRNFAA